VTFNLHLDEAGDLTAGNSPLCLIGLGYVGLPLALRFVEAGFAVWGIEKNDTVRENLLDGVPHVHEPGLPTYLQSALNTGRFHLSADIPADVDFRSFIISVGTPLLPDGSVSFSGVRSTTQQIVEVARPGALVMLRSTVAVGTTRQVVRPMLDQVPGLELAFCPERTLQGRAFDELGTLPQIVAGETPIARARASRMFHALTPCVVEVSSLEVAEIVKLTANAYRDVTFGFANEISRLCDAVGVSATEVVQAGGLGYPRGTMPRPGPVGGSCLTKDPAILANSFHAHGLGTPEVVDAARRANERIPQDAVKLIAECLDEFGFDGQPTAAVLGIAFKGTPETGDVRGSQSVELINALRERFPGVGVRSHDRVSTQADHELLGYQRCESVEDATRDAHILVIGNDHPSYAALDLAALVKDMAQPAVVYDLWGLHKAHASRLPARVGYFAPGEAIAVRPSAPAVPSPRVESSSIASPAVEGVDIEHAGPVSAEIDTKSEAAA
jgi:UDP-N-acetyl-D-mannosaminuronic acid dehydrogenase